MLYEEVLKLEKCTFVSTKDYSESEWLNLRTTGIGGSDAGAIMGMNKYATPLSVYMQKKSTVEELEKNQITNESIQWGKMAESAIRDGLSENLDMYIEAVPGMFTSLENSFCNANLDGLCDAADGKVINGVAVTGLGGLEIKTATERNTEFSDDEVPDSYYCQVQHYMYVTGLQWFILAVLIGKVSGKIYVIPRNPDFIDKLIRKESDFWLNYVEKDEMPAPCGNERESESLNNLMDQAPENVELPEEFAEKCTEYKILDEQIKELKQKQETIKEELKIAIFKNGTGENTGKVIATAGDCKITWSKQLRKTVDTDGLKKAGLFEDYSKTSESLVMRITTPKAN